MYVNRAPLDEALRDIRGNAERTDKQRIGVLELTVKLLKDRLEAIEMQLNSQNGISAKISKLYTGDHGE